MQERKDRHAELRASLLVGRIDRWRFGHVRRRSCGDANCLGAVPDRRCAAADPPCVRAPDTHAVARALPRARRTITTTPSRAVRDGVVILVRGVTHVAHTGYITIEGRSYDGRHGRVGTVDGRRGVRTRTVAAAAEARQ